MTRRLRMGWCGVLATLVASGAVRGAQPPMDDPAADFPALTVALRAEVDSPDNPAPPTPARTALPLPPTGPRELLRLLDVDDSHLAALVDGQPLAAAGEETLLRILFRLPRFGLHDLQRWAEPLAADGLSAEPAAHRADAFQLRGRARRVVRVGLIPEAARLLEFDHYFRVDVELEGGAAAMVCTRQIAASWQSDEPLDEPVSGYGLFLKTTAPASEGGQLVFAAPRLGWHPDKVNEQRGVTPDHVYLASRGFDIGLLAELPELNRQSITAADREAFYQLLAAVGRAPASEWSSRPLPPLDLAALLQVPETQHGRLMTVRGTARRAMKILVDDADIRERFGIDHYYQVDIFVPLGEQTIRLGTEEESPTFTNSFPVTVCVLSLPPELPEGPDIHEQVVIPAVSYKLWAYHSRYVASINPGQRQVAPMLMGVEPRVWSATTARDSQFSLLLAAGFVVTLVVIWLVVWRAGGRDRGFGEQVLQRRREPRRPLDDGSIVSRDGPDFSHLE